MAAAVRLQAANPAGAWSDVRHLLIGRQLARPCDPASGFAGIAGRVYSFCGLGKIRRQSADWVRSTVPPSDSSSSVGSFVWSLPDMSR